jgi:hypothetical protein
MCKVRIIHVGPRIDAFIGMSRYTIYRADCSTISYSGENKTIIYRNGYRNVYIRSRFYDLHRGCIRQGKPSFNDRDSRYIRLLNQLMIG